MTITFTLGLWHFIIAGIVLYFILVIVFLNSDSWRLQKAFDYMILPLRFVLSPFLAVWGFFRHAVIACPQERAEKVIRKSDTGKLKRIKILPCLWIWIDDKPQRWFNKVFLVRIKQTKGDSPHA